jgi:(2Fe-2S) ferredoxin
MEPFRFHVFVCTQEKPEGVPSCPAKGSWRTLEALQRTLKSQGLSDEVQVTTSGCLGLCDHGPMMIAYPEGVWYREVQAEDIPEIVASHLTSGTAVARKAWTDAAAMKAETLDHVARYLAMVKARNEAGVLPDDLNETIRGFMSSRVVLTALELDVFSAVGEGASAEEVGRKVRADGRATEMLLNALASLKLLEKKGGGFHNTPVSLRFLAENSGDSARGGLLHIANLWHRWSTLTECVRAGTAVQTGKAMGAGPGLSLPPWTGTRVSAPALWSKR